MNASYEKTPEKVSQKQMDNIHQCCYILNIPFYASEDDIRHARNQKLMDIKQCFEKIEDAELMLKEAQAIQLIQHAYHTIIAQKQKCKH